MLVLLALPAYAGSRVRAPSVTVLVLSAVVVVATLVHVDKFRVAQPLPRVDSGCG